MMQTIILCFALAILLASTEAVCRESLGCWKDNGVRAIAGGIRFNSQNPIDDCQKYAAEKGYGFFAVQYNTECFTASDAGDTYQKYGGSSDCNPDGRGGSWAQNVYKIVNRENLGCWKDNGVRAIAGGIRFNSQNPIDDCQKYAAEKGYAFFAVQYNTECFTASDAEDTYQKYGGSSDCNPNGRGGSWAQNVYRIC